jgi:Homeobox KN domain
MSQAPNLVNDSPGDAIPVSKRSRTMTCSLLNMALVLLPKRSFQKSQSSEQSENNEKPGAGTTQVQWQGMNPLAWIESICGEVEERESLANGGKIAAPIRINHSNLSMLCAVHPILNIEHGQKTQLQWPTNSFPNVETFDLKEEGQRKRVRVSAKDHGAKNCEWDFNGLFNDPSQPRLLVKSLQCLASEMESIGVTSRFVQRSYLRIRCLFYAGLGRITVADGPRTSIHSDALLLALYNDAKRKMEALIQMARLEAAPSSDGADGSSSSAPEAATLEKKEFVIFMTAWLRENWMNPYPDDDGLSEMAAVCSSTPTVIGNWLINARTRKWRPAIVKAFEMGRPSELLLEDSLNLFDGNPLRELPGFDGKPLQDLSGEQFEYPGTSED